MNEIDLVVKGMREMLKLVKKMHEKNNSLTMDDICSLEKIVKMREVANG